MSSASLLPMARAVFYDANGNPLAGGFVHTYVPGGTTPKTTWQDSAETTPNANPIILDANGSCLLYGAGVYQITVTDSLGNSVPAYSGLSTDPASEAASAAMQPVIQAATVGDALALLGASGSFPSIAALRANATDQPIVVVVPSYYAGGTSGGGVYWLNATDTSSADNGGTIIVDAANHRWYLETFGAPISVTQFGAKLDGYFDDTTAWQAAINYVTSIRNATASGGKLTAPPGFSSISAALLITGPIIIEGAGDGAGSGTGNSGGTVIRTTNATADAFTVTTPLSVIFRNLRIDVFSTTTKTAGSGIAISMAGSDINLGSVVEQCTIVGYTSCIYLVSCANYSIVNNRLLGFLANGIYDAATTSNPDLGDATITGNTIWAQNSTPTDSCIRLDPAGGMEVSSNKLLGSPYGIRLTVSQGPTGTLNIFGNSIEQQLVYCIRVEQSTPGKTYGDIVIANNEIAVVSPPTPQGAISIVAGSSQYLTNILIHDNNLLMVHTTAQPQISIQDGANVQVHNNNIDLGAVAGPSGIATGGNVGNAWVLENTFTGTTSASFYSAGLSTSTVLVDRNGMTFSQLATWRNGSEVYVTDGTCTSSTNATLTGSGSGATALRARGNWYSAQYGVTG